MKEDKAMDMRMYQSIDILERLGRFAPTQMELDQVYIWIERLAEGQLSEVVNLTQEELYCFKSLLFGVTDECIQLGLKIKNPEFQKYCHAILNKLDGR